MKKTFILSMAFVAMSAFSAVAQNDIKLYAGAAFPNGKFGEFKEDYFSLTNGQKYGGAGTGLSLGVSFKYNITGMKGLGIIASANLMFNPLNGDANDFIDEAEMEENFDISRPKYISIPLLVGGNFSYPLSNEVSIFAEAQIGVNFRIITDMTMEQGSSEITMSYSNATTFAYQVGAGLGFKKKYSISVEYYNLGAGKMKGKLSPGSDTMTGAKLTPALIALRLGYML